MARVPDQPIGDDLEAFPSEGPAVEPEVFEAAADFQWPVPADAFEQCEIVPLEGCAETRDQLRAPLRNQSHALVPYRPKHDALQRVVPPGIPLLVRRDPPFSMRQRARHEPEPRRGRMTVVAVVCFAVVSYLDLRMAQLEDAGARTRLAVVPPAQFAFTPAGPAALPRVELVNTAAMAQRRAPAPAAPSRDTDEEDEVQDASGPPPRLIARAAEVRRPAAAAPIAAPSSRVREPLPSGPAASANRSAGETRSETFERPAVRRTVPDSGRNATTPVAAATVAAAAGTDVSGPADTTAAPGPATPAAPAPQLQRDENPSAVPPAARRGAVPVESVPAEAAIRSALTRFRTAYSALDAKAARAIWPSVDERALARAFEGLRSQEIAFDRCETVVNGAEASAACRGRSTYVPRVGPQAPRTNAHEWNFHLKKVNDRWMIDSASFR